MKTTLNTSYVRCDCGHLIPVTDGMRGTVVTSRHIQNEIGEMTVCRCAAGEFGTCPACETGQREMESPWTESLAPVRDRHHYSRSPGEQAAALAK